MFPIVTGFMNYGQQTVRAERLPYCLEGRGHRCQTNQAAIKHSQQEAQSPMCWLWWITFGLQSFFHYVQANVPAILRQHTQSI